MRGRDLLAGIDPDFDPETVGIDDADVLERLHPAVREWWVETFGAYVPENGGFFTPPQKEAIPLIQNGENALICAPTGSGKCVKPDTPLIISEGGRVEVVQADELLERREQKVADIDADGGLYDSNIRAFAFDGEDIEQHSSLIYSEEYSGRMYEIETVYGKTVEVTPSHPLLVETPSGPEWKPVEEIEEGDRIGAPELIELPEQTIELNVTDAISALRMRFDSVITHDDSARLRGVLESANHTADVEESDLRDALALAGLSMSDAAEQLSIGMTTVHNTVTHSTDDSGDGILRLLRSETELLAENEIVVKTANGRLSRFTYPNKVDERLASLCAFVLAEGLLAEYKKNIILSISQTKRSELLEEALLTIADQFNVEHRRKNENDYIIGGSAFALFFAELFGIQMGQSRNVPFPEWVLNAPIDVKQAFISTFLSLEAEVRENAIHIIQASQTKIEQLSYLFLSFGISSSRNTKEKYATNTENQTRREYYGLAIQGKENLSRCLSEFELHHPNTTDLTAYARGDGSGNLTDKYRFDYTTIRRLSQFYEDDQAFNEDLGSIYEVVRRSGRITGRALEKLSSVVDSLPKSEVTAEVREEIDRRQNTNLTWFEVTSKDESDYEGPVIDLTVPGPHNFIGGHGGLYLHNTLASFTSIIDELFRREVDSGDGLDNAVYCLYVSPLKSLANDIHRNLEVPLNGISEKLAASREDTTAADIEIRHAIRHGDTSSAERQKMLEETPHILNTTPETLAILLNAPKFREKLRSVEYVVVDEIHALAESKRGTHLSVSLERLEALADGSPTRIGCSATVEPLSTMGEFLVGRADPGGEPRDYRVVDARFVREFDIKLECPTDDLVRTPRDVVQHRFYDRVHDLIQEHQNTLVFTNTRSGAERVLQNLRERFPEAYDTDNSDCHHGSLSKERRQEVESKLKSGDVDVVTTSTSLELGIDMPHLDLVVQVGSPKSVAALLQRVGRAGHRLGRTVEGRVLVLDRDELIECALMLRKVEEGFVDRVFVPEDAQDVAAQHVYGMAIAEIRPEAEIKRILRRAHPYRHYTDTEWESLMRYLTSDYEGMEEENVYAKIWRDTNDPPGGEHHHEAFPVGEHLIGKRGRMARVIYMTNIGTIPDSFTCDVFTRNGDEWVGNLDEDYLDTLESGDVFVLGGQNFEYRYRRGTKVYVDPTSARPTVPSWFSERLPLSYDLGREMLAFQGELLEHLERGGRAAVRNWLREFPLDENTVRALARLFDEQVRYAGPESVSTDGRIAIETERDDNEYRRHYHVHSTYGRRLNDGLSRLVAYHCARRTGANVQLAVADNGFTVSMPLNRKVDVADVLRSLDPGAVRTDLRAAIEGTDLLQRYFRINATRALMILKRYKGYEKSAAEQQVSSEMLLSFAEELSDFAVIEETYREILEDKLNVAGIEAVLEAIQNGDIEVRSRSLDSPSPRAFGLATLAASDVVLAEDEAAVLQEFHQRVTEAIGEGTEGVEVE